MALFGYGKYRISLERRAESVPLKTLLVQINIPQDAAQVLWTDLEIHQAYEDETLNALDAMKLPGGGLSPQWPDWVMWPECALTGRILRTHDGEWGTWQINHDTIDQVRKAGPFSLIYGVNELEAEKTAEGLVMKPKGRAYNSIAVMSPEDELQTYRKRHLVIFGETIPFVDSLPFLKKIYEQQSGMEFGGSFTPGESLEPLPILAGKTVIGAIPTVCFEDSVSRLTRKFTRPGPQVIINVTNDGWFKQSPAAAQHFANARFRAIELRRPMLRCANSGVSAAVDTTGSTATDPESWKRQVLTDGGGSHFTRGSLLTYLKIPLRPSFSLYEKIGDVGILMVVAIGLILALFYREKGTDGGRGMILMIGLTSALAVLGDEPELVESARLGAVSLRFHRIGVLAVFRAVHAFVFLLLADPQADRFLHDHRDHQRRHRRPDDRHSHARRLDAELRAAGFHHAQSAQ